jgi:hypothetical protein
VQFASSPVRQFAGSPVRRFAIANWQSLDSMMQRIVDHSAKPECLNF